MKPDLPKIKKPWLSSLVTTTALAVFFTVASQLWADGRQEWAFAVLFSGLWLFTSLFWSNARFNEISGLILADIVDQNFRKVSDRIDKLEQRLAKIADGPESSEQNAAETQSRTTNES